MKIQGLALLFSLVFYTVAPAAEDPDELYRQGRFAEAEKEYTQADMDHPKDIRFRYNRGCAAYQNSDYKGAAAAFTSVMRRTGDNETRFKTEYNLGNSTFKQGDFASAAAHYRQAILYNPDSEDARYNLELALREQQKQKKEKAEDQEKQPQEGCSQPEDKEPSQSQNQQDQKTRTESGEQGESETKKAAGPDQGQSPGQESPKDLSGELKALQTMPDEKTGGRGETMSAIDRKKAGALLDNLKEDRSRFMRFQVPEDKKHGVQSGKSW